MSDIVESFEFVERFVDVQSRRGHLGTLLLMPIVIENGRRMSRPRHHRGRRLILVADPDHEVVFINALTTPKEPNTPAEIRLKLLLELVVAKEVDERVHARVAHGQPVRHEPHDVDVLELVDGAE